MSHTVVLVERDRDIAVVRLVRGVTNAIDLQVVNDLAKAVHDVALDPSLIGLVLTGRNDKFFSIGFDIPNLIQADKDDFGRFYRAFNRMCLDLLVLSKPTVAAISGHAIAGGCILALCCDYRFIAEGRKLVGLNEIKLGVPIPYVADCVLRALVGYRNARDIVETGNFFAPREALGLGLVDQVLAQDQVVSEAVAKVHELGTMPGSAHSAIKSSRVAPLAAEIRRGLEEQERLFLQSWHSQAARERLLEAASKF